MQWQLDAAFRLDVLANRNHLDDEQLLCHRHASDAEQGAAPPKNIQARNHGVALALVQNVVVVRGARTPSTCRNRRRPLPHSNRDNPLRDGKMTYLQANPLETADVGGPHSVR